METKIEIDGVKLKFSTSGFDSNVNVDDLTNIHYENLIGETLNITTFLNKVGLLKVKAEHLAKKSKFKLSIYESGFKKSLRSEAVANGNFFRINGERIKLSEKSIEEAVNLDKTWQKLKSDRYDKEMNAEYLGILYWSLMQKSKTLETLIKTSSSEELEKDLKLVNRN